jgi:glycosyltransferase involved in cell wall biosynthesis
MPSEFDVLLRGEESHGPVELCRATEGIPAKAALGGERLRIGIDISRTSREKTGVGYYVSNLVETLANIDQENEYTLYPYFWHCFSPDYQNVSIPNQGNFRLHHDARSLDQIIRAWRSSKPDHVLGTIDVLHSPNLTAPRLKKAKLVVSIHDLSYAVYPEFHTRENLRFSKKQTTMAAKYAAKIIASSHHTKKDLMGYYSIPGERIQVIHLASSKVFYPEREIAFLQRCLARLNIYKNFVLFVGSLEPRKNVKLLIKAYAEYLKADPDRYLLVIAGGRGWLNDDIYALVAELGIERHVRFLGYIQEPDLRCLYSVARVFVYPSIYEGFGLPPLEAMACGAPVITSHTSSLPEVVGDAAILIDPSNVEELFHAMRTVLGDDDLRLQMRKKSLERAKLFSWTRTAQETLAVYQEVCQ